MRTREYREDMLWSDIETSMAVHDYGMEEPTDAGQIDELCGLNMNGPAVLEEILPRT